MHVCLKKSKKENMNTLNWMYEKEDDCYIGNNVGIRLLQTAWPSLNRSPS